MTSSTTTTAARNATLPDLYDLLREQHTRKVDVVAPATAFRSQNGLIRVAGAEAQLDEDGVTTVDGIYRPTQVFDEGMSDKLKIPLSYLRRLRESRPDIYDANVNGWLQGKSIRRAEGVEVIHEPDGRNFLFRGLRPDGDDGVGYGRALLSSSYNAIENLDVLVSVIEGVSSSGVEAHVDACDLTDRKMYVRFSAPGVRVLAPELLKGYRSPFTGALADENPVVFAGFVVSNSEVGDGAYTVTPRIIAEICTNGATITKDCFRKVHMGSRLEEGVVRWQNDTQRAFLDAIKLQTRDTVATFLDLDYLRRTVSKLEEASGVKVNKPQEVIEKVAKKLSYSEEQADSIMAHFIQGGQLTSGGVMQAITAYAQTVSDADIAHFLESTAIQAMEHAAAYAA